MKSYIAKISLSLLLAGALPVFPQTAKQDMKNAGQETKQAAKDAGKAVRTTSKHTAHRVKGSSKHAVNSSAAATEKGAAKVRRKTQQ